MRRFTSTLTLLALSACAHEPGRPTAVGPEPPAARVAHASGTARPAHTDHDDEAALAQRFQSARALSTLRGEASYYSDALAGHPTASGELYEPTEFTAAHRKLPIGTVLRVTRSDGGTPVYVRINDRGPYGSRRRILDLSHAAAERLGILRAGVADVRAEIVAYGAPRKRGRN